MRSEKYGRFTGNTLDQNASPRRREMMLLLAYTVVLGTFFYIEAFGLDVARHALNKRYPGHFLVHRPTTLQPLSASSHH